MDKKGKGKKAPNADEASKLIAAKINQLELDAAGEKDQEAEIGTSQFLFASQSIQARVLCYGHRGQHRRVSMGTKYIASCCDDRAASWQS